MIPDDHIREIEQLADGSSVYEIGEPPQEEVEAGNFYDNLAINFPEEGLKKLSSYLLDAIEEDIESRKEWMDLVKKAEQFLGFTLEDTQDLPFKMASRTYDTTLSTALIRYYATTRAELFPQSGPAGFRINGASNEELIDKGERNRDWLNYYLTIRDKGYYSDSERLILYTGFYGTVFRKVYYDRSLNQIKSRFILPENFIVNNDCASILESERLTHVLHLSKKEIILNQQNGIYRKVKLPYLKSSEIEDENDLAAELNNHDKTVDLDVYTKRSLFPQYEVHTYLSLEDFVDANNGDSDDEVESVPLPYIVTIDSISKEVLSIIRNWKENDPERKRNNYFVQYNYLPGFGIYGLGLAQLAGSNAISLTKLLRQLLDAGSFKNFPGGIKRQGFKEQETTLIAGPGEFIPLDPGGFSLAESFMPFPYSGADNGLRELRIEVMNQTRDLCSTTEMGMLNSKEDIPTGTTLALLETNNRIQSAVLRSIHYSLTQELQLINTLFSETLESEQFSLNGKNQEITSEDFSDEIHIIPISDPALNSTPQRMMRAEAAMKIALQAPEEHNMRAVYKMAYKAMGIDEQEIDVILKPEPEEEEILPLDPVSENINAKLGKPLKVGAYQDHAAHKYVHGVFAQINEDLKPALLAHIREHEVEEYRLEMEQMLGAPLPPIEEIQDPEVQNAIALAISNALEESGASESAQEGPIDPNAILMAEIENNLKIANIKAETEVFKAQLSFEETKAKIESEQNIATLKSETELTKQGISNGNH